MKKVRNTIVIVVVLLLAALVGIVVFGRKSSDKEEARTKKMETAQASETKKTETQAQKEDAEESTTEEKKKEKKKIEWNPDWEYAENSKINSGSAVLYYTQSEQKRNEVICLNAGHGTKGGTSEMTLCHPDGTPKVTGGSTSEGAVKATAINEGTTLSDGTPEAEMNLKVAMLVKEKLLENGFDVLMIRESDDVQLDNIARTVIANNNADCHISIHYDSTENDKGAFYISVPDNESYRSMEPVASNWEEHNTLGESLISGLDKAGIALYGNGSMAIDLTQTSYSTIPSVDLEVGDCASDTSEKTLERIADGIVSGVDAYFK